MTELAVFDRGPCDALGGAFLRRLLAATLIATSWCPTAGSAGSDVSAPREFRVAHRPCGAAVCRVPLLVQRRAALANRTQGTEGNASASKTSNELVHHTSRKKSAKQSKDGINHVLEEVLDGNSKLLAGLRALSASSFHQGMPYTVLMSLLTSRSNPMRFLIAFVVCAMVLSVAIALYCRWERSSPSSSAEASSSPPLRRAVHSAPGPPPSLLTSPCGSPSSRDGRSRWLCPSLVVPSGMELVFAVSELIEAQKQQVSFHIVDMQGQPLSRVVVDEFGSRGGIFLRSLDERPLAWVRTGPLYEKGAGVPQICWPSGEVYGTVAKEDPVPNKRYTLRDKSGQRIFTYNGNFQEKAINVVSASGRLVCDTERCQVPFGSTAHFQVRVAPSVDAGLILCGLLAIDKLRRV